MPADTTDTEAINPSELLAYALTLAKDAGDEAAFARLRALSEDEVAALFGDEDDGDEEPATFAAAHKDGEEWETNGRKYRRTGGETVRIAKDGEEESASASIPESPSKTKSAAAADDTRKAAFLADNPRDGESPQQFAERHYPELAEIKFTRFMPDAEGRTEFPGVVVEGASSPQAREHIHTAYQMRDILKALGAKHARTFIGDKPVTELDSNEDLRGQRPRGWGKRDTWDTVAGAYNGHVCVGVGAHASVSLMGHETGHAIGNRFGLNLDPELAEWHKRLHSKLDPYEQQGGPGGVAGREEMLAESVAVHVAEGKQGVARAYSPEYADWLDAKLRSITA